MKKYYLVFSVVMFLILANFTFAAPIGKVTLVEGRVDVLKAGKNIATPVPLGASVDLGDVYRAKSGSRAEITFTNKNLMRIAQNTRIEITRYSVEGDKSNTVARLYRGRVQAVGADDFIKKAASFAEGNKFEVHTPNAVAGIRGTTMVVFFEKGVTGTVFVSGKGYMYNPQQPTQIVLIVGGSISFISAPGAIPTPPRKASDAEMAMYNQAFTQGSTDSGSGTPAAPVTVPGGGGGANRGGDLQPPTPSPPPPPTLPVESGSATIGPYASSASGNTYYYSAGSLITDAQYNVTMQGVYSLWSGSPSAFGLSGGYTPGVKDYHIWGINQSAPDQPYVISGLAPPYLTEDGAAYKGFITGIDTNHLAEGRLIALYIDPNQNAGILKGTLLAYSDDSTNTIAGAGVIYRYAQKASAIGIQPDDLSNYAETKASSATLWGSSGAGTFDGSGTLHTQSIAKDNTYVANWGIYRFFGGGQTSIPSEPSASWAGIIGGANAVFGKYQGASLYNDVGYWLADINNGTWSGNRISGTLSGEFLTQTKLGTISGELLGTYQTYAPWAQQWTSGTSKPLWRLTKGDGILVAAGWDATILTTTNGTNWTQRLSGTDLLVDVAYGNGVYVAVGQTQSGSSGVLYKSTDAITWTPVTPPDSRFLFGVTYANGLFVVTGASGAIMTSSNGSSWTLQSAPVSAGMQTVTYGNGLFVTVLNNVSGNCIGFATSPNGTNWTYRPATLTSGTWLWDISYANGLYVAVGGDWSSTRGTTVTSTDGINWTEKTIGTQLLRGITYGKGVFMITGGSGTVYTSKDGINWTNNIPGTTKTLTGIRYWDTKDEFVTLTGDGVIFTGDIPGQPFWQAIATGTWQGTPLQFSGNVTGSNLVYYDGAVFRNDAANLNNIMMGSTTSIWNATKASPASIKMMGKYIPGSGDPRIWESAFSQSVVNQQVTAISLQPADWTDYISTTWSRNYTKQYTADEHLKVTRNEATPGTNYGAFLQTSTTYNFQDTLLQYKWKVNGQGTYCGTWNSPGAVFGYGLGGAITTGWSYNGSLLVNSNQWIYTQLQLNSDRTYVVDLSYTGYGAGGLSHYTGTLSQANYDTLSNTFFRSVLADNYASGQFFEIAEANIKKSLYEGYSGYIKGTVVNGNMDTRIAAFYSDPTGYVGYLLGSLSGSAYPEIDLFGMDGTIYRVEMQAGSSLSTISSNYSGTGSGTLSSGSVTFNTIDINKDNLLAFPDWGIVAGKAGGTYSTGGSAPFDFSATLNMDNITNWKIHQIDIAGTWDANNKVTGTFSGYGADASGTTPQTWISVGEVIGTYKPSIAQIITMGAWIETNKFLDMVVNSPSKLQALNIPCVEVGNATLSGSYTGGMGNYSVAMNNVKFFAPTSGGDPKIWATGSVSGSYDSAYSPYSGAIPIAGNGLSANFTMKQWNTGTQKWLAAVTNGTGTYSGTGSMNGTAITSFRGAGAGTINTGAHTFSGTAAGVVKK